MCIIVLLVVVIKYDVEGGRVCQMRTKGFQNNKTPISNYTELWNCHYKRRKLTEGMKYTNKE